MPDPAAERGAVLAAVRYAAAEAERYLERLDADPVRHRGAHAAIQRFAGALPEDGAGALAALRELAAGSDGMLRSPGPRFFHWVVGGGTPAALAADWLASTYDQNAFANDSSPLGTRLETLSVEWLRSLFRLPASWGGVLTTGATMANFTALAAARTWWAQRHGVDIDERGFSGLPAVPVLSSGHIHASALTALAMLGIGRRTVRTFASDGTGRADVGAMEAALRDLGGAPSIIVGNAGEVNAGAFDPLDAFADLAQRYGAWLHIDGAFGLFLRVTPRGDALTAGIDRADSVISDGHKWLNVPYDSGFAFVRDESLLGRAFTLSAAYLPRGTHDYGSFGPESSRRARGIALWATLRAYGREGYRTMVERHLDLAQGLGRRVEEAADLELLAPVLSNIVCFRYRPAGAPEAELDDLNARLGAAVLEDGRVYVGTTRYDGRVAFRPAIVNWRTSEADVDLIVDVIRELGARLQSEARTSV